MKHARTVVAVALFALAAVPSPAAAQSPREQQESQRRNRAELSALQHDLDELSAEERDLLGRLEAAKADDEAAAAAQGALEERLVDTNARLQAADDALAAAEQQVEATVAAESSATSEARVARAELRQNAISSYIGQGTTAAVNKLMTAKDVRELAAYQGYADAVAHRQEVLIERAEAAEAALAAATAAARAARDAAAAARDSVLAEQAQLRAQQVEAEQAAERRAATTAELQRLLADVEARRGAHLAKVAAIEADNAAIEAELRAVRQAQLANPGAVPADFALTYPIPGAVLTSTFGPRVHPIFGDARPHNGVDFAAPRGTPIGSAGVGTVLFAGQKTGFGNTVIVDHGGGLTTIYAHMDSITVAAGQPVEPGTVVGTLGSTGYSTGPHLHLETRLDGAPVDPFTYLR